MPLSFNVAPFWDDYSEEKHFYRILFRPSVAVQARELTQSQTILQQQITNLGNSIYQHGAMVTPGQIATDPKTNYVALQPTYGVILGVPVPINLGTFTSQVIQGETTGLQAQVIYSTAAVGSDPNTLYVKYLNSGTSGETQFDSNEVLDIVGNGAQATAVAVTSGLNVVVNVTMVVGGQGYTTAPTVTITDSTNVLGTCTPVATIVNGVVTGVTVTGVTNISAGDTLIVSFAPTVSTGVAESQATNPCGLAISVQISQGVYYIWGFFVRVESQYLLLNKYSNIVSTRVGLEIVESIITPEEDSSLNDNSLGGSPNYAAPGGYRYKIDLNLTSKSLTDTTTDKNFVELVRLVNSVTQKKVTTDQYSTLETEMAQRMADANGNFAVRNYAIDIRESLDASFVTEGTAVSAIQGGPSNSPPSTIVLQSGDVPTTVIPFSSAVNGAYVGFQIYLTSGTGAGQTFTITAYDGSTKTASLDALFLTNGIPDTTTTYTISDLSKVNRGINPPYPFGSIVNSGIDGLASQFAVGMESGRAYVDGYLVNTLSTTYVPMDKARTTAQSNNALISAPIGNYIIAKNMFNLPTPAISTPAEDFLTINFSNIKSAGSATTFNSVTNGLGTARVHSVEFYQGISEADPTALWKIYLFDIQMNVGADINSARSFALISSGTNDNGNSLNAYGDICTIFPATNVNGTGLAAGATLIGPNTVGTELVVLYDAINNAIITESNAGNTTQILTTGQFSITSPTTTGTLGARTQLFHPSASTLIYPLPQNIVKTIADSGSVCQTDYYIRAVFEAQINGSNDFIFNTSSLTTSAIGAQFGSTNPNDYVACVVVAGTGTPLDIGKFLDLADYISGPSFSAGNTTLTLNVTSGVGSSANSVIKLIAPVFLSQAAQKSKTLITPASNLTVGNGAIQYATPTATMSLAKADIVSIIAVYDSGNPANAPDPGTNTNIKNNYVFDTGQRDYFYDVGSISLLPKAPGPLGQVLIQFQYFEHSGAGDYFSVDSYNPSDVAYGNIPTYKSSNGTVYNLRDCLDFRPRISDTDVGFSETGSGASFSSALSSTNFIMADFQYYLAQINKIYLDEYGNFNVIDGTPSLTPLPPSDPLDGMMLYTIGLNPYTFSTIDLSITPTSNPRYTMQKIGELEQRIANLEYYTSMNLLEQSTASMQIVDPATGLNRYQNGFIVDNFADFSVGNVFDGDFRCSIDPSTNTLRPQFLQGNNNLIFNPANSSSYVLMNPGPLDATTSTYKAGLLMLPFTSTIAIQQPFATNILNVNPFAVFAYYGDINLNPNSDSWFDTTQLPTINISDDATLDEYQYAANWSGTVWGNWQTSWVGTPTTTSTTQDYGGDAVYIPNTPANNVLAAAGAITGYTGTISDQTGQEYDVAHNAELATYGGGYSLGSQPSYTTTITSTQVGQIRTGVQTSVTLSQTSQTINNVVVDQSISPYIRSRRVKVIGQHFKPQTQLYPYFDTTDISAFCRPYADPQFTPTFNDNHGGDWPSTSVTWGGDWSPQDNANEGTSADAGDTGQTATYFLGPLNAPLFTDELGTITLFFEIPCTSIEEFKTGVRDFRLTDSPVNDNNADSYGDANYTAAGVIEQTQEQITSIYTPTITTKQVSQSQVITQNTTQTSESSDSTELVKWIDPLAQSFLVKTNGGLYVTQIDVYFQGADPVVPITMQIRDMVNGYPGQTVVPLSEKTLYPNNPILSSGTSNGGTYSTIAPSGTYTPAVINITQDASVPTSFVFDAPVYLYDGTAYCFVLIANSINYWIYTAEIGGVVVGSTNIVSSPPYLGNVFKSQNASTWVADPTQNMKFTIWGASFTTGTPAEIVFTSSSVQPDILGILPFQTVNGSVTVRVRHENHGMPKGSSHNSSVTISNVAAGTYNGITAAYLTGTFIIDNVDLNSYTITAGGSATATGFVGPDGVVATKNIQYDAICPNFNTFSPTGTSTSWGAEFTTGKSVNNNVNATQEPYVKDASFINLPINITSYFLAPRMIASDINETNSITGANAYLRKSLVLQGTLTTTQANLSPVVDLSSPNAILPNNLIDDPTFSNVTNSTLDIGTAVSASAGHTLSFSSEVILTVIAVTNGPYTVAETVTGAASGATGTVVSWDGIHLTLSGVSGVYQDKEAVTGGTSFAIGTVLSQQYVNTITNADSNLDLSVFVPGYDMTITGGSGNLYTTSNPVTILTVDPTTYSMTVDTNGSTPFTTSASQTDKVLTQYTRFVSELGPDNCTTAARYITRQFNLASPANSLQISFNINLPPGSYVDVYYRIQQPNNEQPFSTLLYELIEPDSTADTSASSNPNEYKTYTYTANDIGPFNAFSIKIVMRGGNSSQVPLIQQLRSIALAT